MSKRRASPKKRAAPPPSSKKRKEQNEEAAAAEKDPTTKLTNETLCALLKEARNKDVSAEEVEKHVKAALTGAVAKAKLGDPKSMYFAKDGIIRAKVIAALKKRGFAARACIGSPDGIFIDVCDP